ncbi:hypothetical protein [Streptomyces niger]|uniref:hypothetical protein n=1 Tax=Streptomyces niger TaxID=66373 RepID=UPI00069B5BBD|nr:hypothetical protein [Streptomyces niger]
MATDPAAQANEAIRAFMRRREGRPLWPDERAEYEKLLEAWVIAIRDIAAAETAQRHPDDTSSPRTAVPPAPGPMEPACSRGSAGAHP